MSRVVITGNASGTGDFTIAAPNSNTDRTLTLPDEAGEVVVTDGTTLAVNNTNDRVGIGTSSPSAKLHVANDQGGGTGRILFDANVSSGYETSLNVTDTGFEVTSKSDSRPVVFNTGNTPAERMRIDGSGRVLIGTTTPAHSLGKTGIVFNGAAEVAMALKTTYSSTGSSFIYFVNSTGAIQGFISASGTTGTAYNTSSDYRLKENVVEITDGIDRVKLLNPSRFNFIADSDTTVDGFLAHEAQAVVPEAVTGTHNEVDDDGNPVMQGIDQSKLVPLLTAALQEAITKIEALEARVTALENA